MSDAFWAYLGILAGFLVVLALILSVVFAGKNIKQWRGINERILTKKGFVISKSFGSGVDPYAMWIDAKAKRIALTNNVVKEVPLVISFAEIVRYEVYENGAEVKISGRSAASLVGGVFLGIPGAIAGGSGRRTETATCNNLQIRLFLNNLERPLYTFKLIEGSIDESTKGYVDRVTVAHEIVATLDLVLRGDRGPLAPSSLTGSV